MSQHGIVTRTGQWVVSDNPESWTGEPAFDTREEAVAYAKRGSETYVGRAVFLTDQEVARAFLRDVEDAQEDLCLQDEWAWCEDDLINTPSDAAVLELREFTTAWVRRHGLRDPRWRVEDVEQIAKEDSDA